MDILPKLSGRLVSMIPDWKDKLSAVQGDALKFYNCILDIENNIDEEDLVSGVSFELQDVTHRRKVGRD